MQPCNDSQSTVVTASEWYINMVDYERVESEYKPQYLIKTMTIAVFLVFPFLPALVSLFSKLILWVLRLGDRHLVL